MPIVESVLSVSSSLWREVSINFMAPAASEEEFKDGAFRFIYGAMKTGDRLLVKVDGQINPALIGELRGQIAVSDGDRPLAALPLKIWVRSEERCVGKECVGTCRSRGSP